MEDIICKKIEALTLPNNTQLQWWMTEQKKGDFHHDIVVGDLDDVDLDEPKFIVFCTKSTHQARRLWKGLKKLVEHLSNES